jgi:AcrR family transcriptional regulator
LRSVARQAGVDPSLVGHYFGGREGLLLATLELPVDPMDRIMQVLSGGREGLGARIVHTFVTTWDPHRETISALLRSATGSGDETAVSIIARDVLVARLTDVLGGDRLGAGLVAGQVLGLAMARYVLDLDPVREATVDDLVRAYGPAIQTIVDR